MNEVRTDETDVPAAVFVGQSLSITHLIPAETAERIEVLFGVDTLRSSGNIAIAKLLRYLLAEFICISAG